ncbi:hypothetical protein H5410_002238 [Solanum commersonii]|uniref:DUF4371 domain-containing protein n=1 Tax=Solanum commersonii TaxID=4109 RepID=A0A9J6B1E3_SOLCO|nr:hypothetical protein H5410_002238 [Solanum commersonii]
MMRVKILITKVFFLNFLKFHGVNRPDVEKVILQHAPKNDMMICSTIQKEIMDAYTNETIKVIIKNLDGDDFGILVDQSKDISHKEKLTLGDTCWRSHFKTLENFMIIFSSIANVLKDMNEDSPHDLDKLAAGNLLDKIQEIEFIFVLHLMFKILLLNELNKALQKKDQDIVNAMRLLNLSKRRLQIMRESGLESLMDEVYSFCGKHDILILKMTEDYPRLKCKEFEVSYLYHFRVEVFYAVINLQLQELNNRFDVVTSDLLLGMDSLNPVDSFANFSKRRIMKLAEYYKSDFGDNQLRDLSYHLDSFIVYG